MPTCLWTLIKKCRVFEKCRVFGLNSLTVAIRGSGYKLFVKWHRYPGARLVRYVQNGAVIRRPG